MSKQRLINCTTQELISQIENNAWAQIMPDVDDQLRWKIEHQIWDNIMFQVERQVRRQVWAQVLKKLDDSEL